MVKLNEITINICQNCKHYWAHYVLRNGRFIKTAMGHCAKHFRRQRFTNNEETCLDFEDKSK